MIEFVLKNRRLRLHPDGVIYCRSHKDGHETKKEKWYQVSFHYDADGYERSTMSVDGVYRNFSKHRLVKLAHNPTWDIFDVSPSNCIDHENHTRDDNSNDNLRVVTAQQNSFNRSNVKGYTWNEKRKKWVAQIKINGKSKYLGGFEKEEEAHNAYLKAKAIYHII
jgi:hypothetical protein